MIKLFSASMVVAVLGLAVAVLPSAPSAYSTEPTPCPTQTTAPTQTPDSTPLPSSTPSATTTPSSTATPATPTFLPTGEVGTPVFVTPITVVVTVVHNHVIIAPATGSGGYVPRTTCQ